MADKKKTHDVFETALDNPDDYDRARFEERQARERHYQLGEDYDESMNKKIYASPEGKQSAKDFRDGAGVGLSTFVAQRLLRRVIRGAPKYHGMIAPATGTLSTVGAGGAYGFVKKEGRRAEHRKKNKSRQEK